MDATPDSKRRMFYLAVYAATNAPHATTTSTKKGDEVYHCSTCTDGTSAEAS